MYVAVIVTIVLLSTCTVELQITIVNVNFCNTMVGNITTVYSTFFIRLSYSIIIPGQFRKRFLDAKHRVSNT